MSQGFSPVLIACEGHTNLPLDSILDFQGNLKDLSKESYQKFKKQLLELGFSEPISVWDNDGKIYCLNGHQRLRTLKAMREEGYFVPKEIPVNMVQAKDLREAKKKVLALTSQYGQITDDGLYEFASTAGITFEELNTDFRLPEIDLGKFEKNFGPEEPVDVGSMSERFGAAPFSVLDARQGWWQERKRQWIALGIKSEEGRGGGEMTASYKNQDKLSELRHRTKKTSTKGLGNE